VFLVNSRYPLLSATAVSSWSESLHQQRHTFSRSYGVNLLSSLATVLSSALVYSTRLPESVCGTVTETTRYEDFLGSMGSMASRDPKESLVITSRRCGAADLPTAPAYGLEPAHPTAGPSTLLRPPFAQTLPRWCRNINLLSITYAFRPRLRNRLTLRRLP
jgi:hypothetical protein